MDIHRRFFVALLAGLAVLPGAYALADGDDHKKGDRENEHDHRDAARARKSGDILPLRDILAELEKTYKGEVVGIEFEKEGDTWVYEIKKITESGRYLEIYVDARTNKILKLKGK